MSTRLLQSATLAVVALAANAFAADATVSATTTTAATNDAARIAALEKAVSDLMQEKGENWLTAQRASEIRSVVQDVLSDADTRASLASTAATAGYDDGFFIASPDGNFKMKLNGQLQSRFAYNWLSSRTMTNSQTQVSPVPIENFYQSGIAKAAYGFEIRRAKVAFSGHVIDPGWQYEIELAYQQFFGSNQSPAANATGSNSTTGQLNEGGGVSGGDNYAGGFALENAYIERSLGSGFGLKVGQFKSPFLREWLTSSKNQLAAERSIVNSLFSTGWTQGLELDWRNDHLNVMLSYNDGANNANLGSTSGTQVDNSGNIGVGFAQWAFTGRVEYMLFGNWKQFGDFSSMRGEASGLLFGAGVNWQRGGQQDYNDTNQTPTSGNADAHFITWTVDATWDLGGASMFAAWIMNTSYGVPAGTESINTFGSIIQGGYFISDTVEVFGRWEWMNTQSTSGNQAGPNIQFDGSNNAFVNNIGTVGMNWYLNGRNVKFTTDCGVSWNPVIFQTGLYGDNIAGANYRQEGSAGGGQIVARTQLQLLF
jgi:hypothetical protein